MVKLKVGDHVRIGGTGTVIAFGPRHIEVLRILVKEAWMRTCLNSVRVGEEGSTKSIALLLLDDVYKIVFGEEPK